MSFFLLFLSSYLSCTCYSYYHVGGPGLLIRLQANKGWALERHILCLVDKSTSWPVIGRSYIIPLSSVSLPPNGFIFATCACNRNPGPYRLCSRPLSDTKLPTRALPCWSTLVGHKSRRIINTTLMDWMRLNLSPRPWQCFKNGFKLPLMQA